ncbi:MAG: TonB-dependent receptor [Bacteroidales bacterium]|nr:TonB-dependent receptor [Bacteroidales bacterium]
MKKFYISAVFMFCLILNLPVFSQTISGTVKDASGLTLPGVSVYIKATTIGTTTDLDGNYKIAFNVEDITGDSLTVVFSFVGYKTLEFTYALDPDANITKDVILPEDIEMLDEFVVVGYGVQKKSDVTGAISSIKPNEITNLPVTRLDQALQGKAAGVQVNSTTGAPGESVKVRIRGVGTINNNDPLYIIDGVPTKDITGILNTEDIESMSILKDASSAAIYGSRAGNGVIIIKTKKGSSGKASLNYNFYTGIQTHGYLTPMCNTDEYINIYNIAALTDGSEPIPDEILPQLANTNWLEEIFRPAFMQSHQLSISGGNDKSTYLIGGGYQYQEGIILNSAYERVNFRVSLSSKLAKWVNVGTNINTSYSDRDIIGGSGDGYGGNGGSVIRYAFFRTPPMPVYNSNGEYSDLPQFDGYDKAKLNMWFGDGYNPVGLANKYDWTEKIYRMFGNFFAEFDIIKGLRFRSDFGIDLSIIDKKRFNENWGTDLRINSPNSMTKGTGIDFTYNWTNTLNYKKVFNEKHITSFLVGTEAIKNSFHEQIGTDRSFPDQSANFRYLGNGLSLSKGASESENGWSLLSAFARVNYNYDNRYLVEGVIRFDGSSMFAQDNRWGAFYSGSLGWNIHNENFMKGISWINQMKLRASIGQSGNQEIKLYNYISIIGDNYNYPFGGSNNYGYAVTDLGNKNTTWETTTTYDIGMDLEFLDGRLAITTDYYWRFTDDMLIPIPLPPSGGSALPPYVNAGKVLNRGLEVEVFWRETKGAFKYEVGGNVSTLYNEVLSLSNGRPIPAGRIDNGVFATLTEEGQPIGSFYLYEMEGIFQNEVDIFTHAYQGKNIEPGDVKFKDQNNDGVINEKDRIHVGSPFPKLMYGLTASFSWKNFDLALFFQGVSGNNIYMQINQDIEGFYRAFNVTKRFYDNRWTGDGSTNDYPRASWIGAANNKKASTRFLEPGSYFRFKNVSLGYNFKFKETSAIEGFRIYFSVQNLFTITKYPGLDPEMYESNNLGGEDVKNADLASGIDWGTYPNPRIYTIGINLNL